MPFLPSSECAVEMLKVDPVSQPLEDAPITLNETICMPPAHDYLLDTATTEVARCYYIGEDEDSVGAAPPLVPEDATAAYIAAL